MINKELMDLLFEEQVATNKKKFWVFFSYIKRTPTRKIGKQDRENLCKMFDVNMDFVETTIAKTAEEKLAYFKKTNPPIEKIFRGGLNAKRFEELLDKE
jgi:hypothetical protein